jgi:hypothetical protein
MPARLRRYVAAEWQRPTDPAGYGLFRYVDARVDWCALHGVSFVDVMREERAARYAAQTEGRTA